MSREIGQFEMTARSRRAWARLYAGVCDWRYGTRQILDHDLKSKQSERGAEILEHGTHEIEAAGRELAALGYTKKCLR